MKYRPFVAKKEILEVFFLGVGGAIAAFIVAGTICAVLTWYLAPALL